MKQQRIEEWNEFDQIRMSIRFILQFVVVLIRQKIPETEKNAILERSRMFSGYLIIRDFESSAKVAECFSIYFSPFSAAFVEMNLLAIPYLLAFWLQFTMKSCNYLPRNTRNTRKKIKTLIR